MPFSKPYTVNQPIRCPVIPSSFYTHAPITTTTVTNTRIRKTVFLIRKISKNRSQITDRKHTSARGEKLERRKKFNYAFIGPVGFIAYRHTYDQQENTAEKGIQYIIW